MGYSKQKTGVPFAVKNPDEAHLSHTPANSQFMGWNTEPNGSGRTYQPGDMICVGVEDLNSGKQFNLYPMWIRTFNVTFYPNGGQFPNDDAYKTLVYLRGQPFGENLAEVNNIVSKAYNHLIGWFTDRTNGDQWVETRAVTEGKILYAHWASDQVQFTWNANGGTFPTSEADTETTNGLWNQHVVFPAEDPQKTGMVFDGWFTERVDGTKLTSNSIVAVDSTFWAHWTANTYTITFDANGGTPATQTKEVTYGQQVGELPTATFDGKTFLGWFYDDTDESEQLLSTTQYAIAGNHTYFAHWEDVNP